MLRAGIATSGLAIAIILAGAPIAHATSPGDNGLIAFQVDSGHGNRIYTIEPDGSDLRLVTTGTADAQTPDWSPDGEWIVFTKNGCKIALIHPDGTDLHRIDPAPGGCESDATFTPDGQHLVFERQTDTDDAIWIMDLDGSNRRRIGNGGNGEAHTAEISPDGRTVSFLSFAKGGLSAIFGIDINGGPSWQITPTLWGMTFKHDWSPDGTRLVVSDNAENTDRPVNVVTIRSDGEDIGYLTHYTSPSQRAYAGTYSPDGQWIVYRHEHGDLSALVIVRTNGTDRRALLPLSSFRPRFIDWGPEG
jgi:Tol biopolymer transport system component